MYVKSTCKAFPRWERCCVGLLGENEVWDVGKICLARGTKVRLDL